MKTALDKVKGYQIAALRKVEKELTHKHNWFATIIIGRVLALYPKIKEVQPDITSLWFNMGGWGFMGLINGNYKGEEDEPVKDNDWDFVDYVLNPDTYTYEAPVNAAIIEIVELCNYFVDCGEDHGHLFAEEGLNFSTMISEIDQDGVIFRREIAPKTPFGHEPLADTEASEFVAMLKLAGIPYRFQII